MKMLDRRTTEFLEVLSSKEPVPGGGGASAAVGAMGAALGLMVANLTTGKKAYEAVEEEICRCRDRLVELRDRLVELTDADAKVFEPLSKAYRLPKSTQEQIQTREQVMEQALLAASQVPLEMMEAMLEVIEELQVLGLHGSRMAVSDVGAGLLLSQAALESAALNVYINTKLMKDQERARQLKEQADELIQHGKEQTQAGYQTVRDAIC